MNGPLEREFAQVRKMLDPATRPLWEGVGPKPEHHALAALSSIERHVQDMGDVLTEIRQNGRPDFGDCGAATCEHPGCLYTRKYDALLVRLWEKVA